MGYDIFFDALFSMWIPPLVIYIGGSALLLWLLLKNNGSEKNTRQNAIKAAVISVILAPGIFNAPEVFVVIPATLNLIIWVYFYPSPFSAVPFSSTYLLVWGITLALNLIPLLVSWGILFGILSFLTKRRQARTLS